MLDKKGTSKAASAPNKKVIITKTGKVIELSDESGQAPVKQQESGVIEAIDNIRSPSERQVRRKRKICKGVYRRSVKCIDEDKVGQRYHAVTV